MISLRIGLLCGFIAVLTLGCETVSPTAQSFGISYRQAKANQILNPAASDNLDPVEGFNGDAAKLAMDRYRKSFEEAPRRQQFVLPTGQETRLQ